MHLVFYFFQNPGTNNTNIVNTSNRPINMAKSRIHKAVAGKLAKLSVTASNPGPTLVIQAETAEKAVIVSTPSPIKTIDRTI